MDWTPIKTWLQQGTTILGLAACGSAVSAYLLGQATPKQALAAAIGGIIAIAMKQAGQGPTVVTGAMPVVNTTETTISPAAGSTTTIKAVGLLATAGLALSMAACSTAQVTTSLNDVRLFCQTKDAVVALSTVAGTPVLAQGQTASYVNTACALAGGVAVSPPASPSAAPVVAIPAVSVPL